jgi:hypothetical protein
MAAKKKETSIAVWEKQMAEQAIVAAKMVEGSGGGTFFKLAGGVLTFDGAPLLDNRMAVVILDSVLENVHYEGDYDPDNVTSPNCYAFGREDGTLVPHEKVENPVNATCDGCPNNEWGSADRGKGKACRNTVRLALIPAGKLDKDGEFTPYADKAEFEGTSIAYMKLPVTSVAGFAVMVKQIAGVFKRPPHCIFTKIEVVPSEKNQFAVTFEALDPIPNNLLGVVMERNKEAQDSIIFPYPSMGEEQESKPAAKKRGSRKSSVKKVGGSKKKY